MFKKFISFAFVIILFASTFAISLYKLAERQTRIDSIKSEILRVNRKYSGYLLKNFCSHTEKKNPVFYLLQGLCDNNNDWFNDGNLQYIANYIIDAGNALGKIANCRFLLIEI